jgi:hypothetical protein
MIPGIVEAAISLRGFIDATIGNGPALQVSRLRGLAGLGEFRGGWGDAI